jgi:Mn2+/Fe2+ NRAMP family transporter
MTTRPHKRRRSVFDYFRIRKAGIITGSADNDPSGIVTYTQAGAVAGTGLLWTMLAALPFLAVIEEMSARVGVVAKRGLNRVIAEKFGLRWATFAAMIVLICNIATISADLAGMSEVAYLISGVDKVYWVLLFGLVLLWLLLSKGYKIVSRYLLFITPIFLLYIISSFMVDAHWVSALRDTVVPNLQFLTKDKALLAVAIIGTTVSPYLIFWQTTEEIEDHKTVKDLDDETAGTISGMFWCQIITFFIIVSAAAVFFGQNKMIESAYEAAASLRPLAGDSAFLLFSIGILGSGALAIPVLAASTAYTVSDTFKWGGSLEKEQWKAQGFYGIILLSMVIGTALAASNLNAIYIMVLSQALNGFLIPFLVFFLLRVSNDKKIMGEYTNRFWSNFIGWISFAFFIFFDLVLVWQMID